MNRIQANLLITMIKNECSNHKNYCVECPFEYINEEGSGSCFIEDGFTPYEYDDKLLKKYSGYLRK